MKNGISTSMQTGADALCLASSGINFVFRYYSATTTIATKRLTVSEAQALTAAGIEIGAVYEDGPTSANYFTNGRGVRDGERAFQYAQQIGQPAGSAIYFAVDYDAPASDLSAIISYFQGVQSGLNVVSGGSSPYAIGVYGSGLVCQAIKQDNSLAKYSWLAESRGWRGTVGYTEWNAIQKLATLALCGLAGPTPETPAEYEECQALDDFGGFSV